MTTSQMPSTENISDRKAAEKISTHLLSYHRQRTQNQAFEELMAFFASRAEHFGTTRKDVAERLGKDPSQITRWLSGPGNLTLDTISDLLIALDAHMEFRARGNEEDSRANFAHPLTINCLLTGTKNTGATRTVRPTELSASTVEAGTIAAQPRIRVLSP